MARLKTGALILLACMVPSFVSYATPGRETGQWGFEVGNGRKDIRYPSSGRSPGRVPRQTGAGYVDEFTEVVTPIGKETPENSAAQQGWKESQTLLIANVRIEPLSLREALNLQTGIAIPERPKLLYWRQRLQKRGRELYRHRGI